jgi:hypothetical protein
MVKLSALRTCIPEANHGWRLTFRSLITPEAGKQGGTGVSGEGARDEEKVCESSRHPVMLLTDTSDDPRNDGAEGTLKKKPKENPGDVPDKKNDSCFVLHCAPLFTYNPFALSDPRVPSLCFESPPPHLNHA